MSYSRWGKDSVWYTFWDGGSSTSTYFKLPTKKLMYEQYFEICDLPNSYHVSYGELKEKGIKKVVKEIQVFFADKPTQFRDYTKMRWMLVEFMTDVENDFKWKNFFMDNWYYHGRYRFLLFIANLKLRLKSIF